MGAWGYNSFENDDAMDWLGELEESTDRRLCASLHAGAVSLRNVVPLAGYVHLLIGPEGDLTEAETSQAIEHGFELVRLGPYILRAETAAIAGIAMLQGIAAVTGAETE